MFLETWMLMLAVAMYGVCAYVSRKAGFAHGVRESYESAQSFGFKIGATTILAMLSKNNVIVITDDDITPGDNILNIEQLEKNINEKYLQKNDKRKFPV